MKTTVLESLRTLGYLRLDTLITVFVSLRLICQVSFSADVLEYNTHTSTAIQLVKNAKQ